MSLRAVVVRIFCLLAALLIAGVAAAAQSDDFQEAQKLFRAGQPAPALERVEALLKNNPKDARGRFLKGLILTEQNKTAEAIRVFSAMTEDYPEMPEPYNNLAALYAQQGQYDRARSTLELAIRSHPNYATAHENLGDVYAKLASQSYDKALQLDKKNAAVQTKLGLIKELFSSTAPKGIKPSAGKTGASIKPAATVLATATEPAPAAPLKPAEPVAANPAADASQAAAVLKTVNGWAQAWSNNDVGGYLGYYAGDFETPRGEPRSDWEAARKAQIAKPKKVVVKVEGPKIKFSDSNRVAVSFRQNYNSPNLKVTSQKTLVLVKNGERWLIQQEIVGS